MAGLVPAISILGGRYARGRRARELRARHRIRVDTLREPIFVMGEEEKFAALWSHYVAIPQDKTASVTKEIASSVSPSSKTWLGD
jgi:hypothetical protein